MADIFSAIVGFFGVSLQINEFVVTPLRNKFRYLFHYNESIQQLRVEVENLENDTAILQLRINDARRNLQVIRANVETYISTVAAKKTDADTILGAASEVQNVTCLCGTCLNLKSRYSLGKQAKKMTEDVKQLRVECGSFVTIADPPLPTAVTEPEHRRVYPVFINALFSCVCIRSGGTRRSGLLGRRRGDRRQGDRRRGDTADLGLGLLQSIA